MTDRRERVSAPIDIRMLAEDVMGEAVEIVHRCRDEGYIDQVGEENLTRTIVMLQRQFESEFDTNDKMGRWGCEL